MDDRFHVRGVPIDASPADAVIRRILDSARERRFLQIATVNVDFLVNSQRDDEVKEILQRTGINVPDGAPVVWAGRVLGHRGVQRLAGVDLVLALADAAAQEGLAVFLLGGEQNAAAAAGERLRSAVGDLRVFTYEPPMTSLEEMDDGEILRRIEATEPHLLFVALGHPKQDKWIYRNRGSLPMAAMGVGCTFDLLAGRHRRAPVWMQRAGLEWAYRLGREPQRLARRYASDGLWIAARLIPWLVVQRTAHA